MSLFSDHVAITNLIYRYAELADSGDIDGQGALFTHGEFKGMFGGHTVDAKKPQRIFEPPLKCTTMVSRGKKHIVANLQIYVADDGNSATCRSISLPLQEVPGTKKLQVIGVGRYLDEFIKIDGEWHFASRQLIRDLTGDLSNAVPEEFLMLTNTDRGPTPGASDDDS